MTSDRGFTAYVAVTGAYWAFMLTDGALRMLILLHFHGLGFSAVQLAYLFVLYEIAGIVTNLYAGWIAARYGLISTLFAGLGIQIGALVALAQLEPGWAIATSLIFVMAVQGASGVAKDLTKMSAKSAVKLLAPTGEGALFLWVARLTGSKNAVKGLGFFIGAVMLGTIGMTGAVVTMALILSLILVLLICLMPRGLPAGKKDSKFRDILSKNSNINWLSFGRVFLFGARDVWFVVGIPVYFYSVWSDGTVDGNRHAFFLIGSFMAIWIIFYGAIQASAPRVLAHAENDINKLIRSARNWGLFLVVPPALLASFAFVAPGPAPWLTTSLVVGLFLFGAIFAVNSSLHSFLILEFTTGDRVTRDVGFYYMANATGRLLGTVLSGVSYQIGGLALCLATATALLCLNVVGVSRLSSARPSI